MASPSNALTPISDRMATMPRWLVLSLGGLALLLALGLPTLIIPFATDQVWFALGARTILDGDQLYRDFWDQKPPLIYLLYAVPFALTGEHMASVRVLDLANVALAMVALFFLCRRFFSERAGVFAAALYAFAYLCWTQPSDLAETEAFMAAPVALALTLYLPDDSRDDAGLRAVVTGILFSIAFAFKAPTLLFLLALPAAELLLRRDGVWSPQKAIGRLALAAVGFAIVPVALVLYMALTGVLDEYLDIQRDYTADYNSYRFAPDGVSHMRFVMDATSEFIRNAAFLTVPALAAVLFSVFRKEDTKAVGLLALVALLGLAGIWWQGKMFSYHWVLMLPLLAPLAGYALAQVTEQVARLEHSRALAAFAVLAVAFVALAYPTLRDTYDDYRVLVDYVSGSLDRRDVETHYYPLYQYNHELVDYVKANSGDQDRIYVWGLWPQVEFWLDGREPFNRFTVNSGMRATWSPQKYRDELMRDLRASPPRYFAIGQGDRQAFLVGTWQTSQEYISEDFAELEAFLADNYTFVRDFTIMTLYERKAVDV